MRVYLVDGSNAVRRGDYDPRFPEVEERRAERRAEALAHDWPPAMNAASVGTALAT